MELLKDMGIYDKVTIVPYMTAALRARPRFRAATSRSR